MPPCIAIMVFFILTCVHLICSCPINNICMLYDNLVVFCDIQARKCVSFPYPSLPPSFCSTPLFFCAILSFPPSSLLRHYYSNFNGGRKATGGGGAGGIIEACSAISEFSLCLFSFPSLFQPTTPSSSPSSCSTFNSSPFPSLLFVLFHFRPRAASVSFFLPSSQH